MKTDPRCIPCFFNQSLRAAKQVSNDPIWLTSVMQEVAAYIAEAPLQLNPSSIGTEVHRVLRKALGDPDPYKKVKAHDTAQALKLLSQLRVKIQNSHDQLLEALRVSAAANVMDFGLPTDPDPEPQMSKALEKPFPKKGYMRFLDELKKASNILVLTDNAGEVVFDRLLIEAIRDKGIGAMVAVKEGPAINDATLDDAYAAGIHKVAGIMTTGTDSVGLDLEKASDRFKRRFNSAELILAKGQGHFETLQGNPGPIWFLFVIKCDVVADELKAKVGDIMFFRGSPK